MNMGSAWQKGYTGKNVVISILDDGIQTNHPDLAHNYVSKHYNNKSNIRVRISFSISSRFFFPFQSPIDRALNTQRISRPVMKVCISFLVPATWDRISIRFTPGKQIAFLLFLPIHDLFPRNVDGPYYKLGFQRFRTHLTISYSVFAGKVRGALFATVRKTSNRAERRW